MHPHLLAERLGKRGGDPPGILFLRDGRTGPGYDPEGQACLDRDGPKQQQKSDQYFGSSGQKSPPMNRLDKNEEHDRPSGAGAPLCGTWHRPKNMIRYFSTKSWQLQPLIPGSTPGYSTPFPFGNRRIGHPANQEGPGDV